MKLLFRNVRSNLKLVKIINVVLFSSNCMLLYKLDFTYMFAIYFIHNTKYNGYNTFRV